ncbi:MAG: class I adenylate-forming enzyme family protein [Polymorphobacter sp.]
MTAVDPVLAELTAPGAPFAITTDARGRRFAAALDDLDKLIETAHRHGDATFLVEGDMRLTFTETFARRDALAAQLGVGVGDRVAIAMRNGTAWIIAVLAVIHSGAVAVLVNSRNAGEEMRAAIDDTDVALVLADAARARLLRDAGYGATILLADDFAVTGSFTRTAPPAQPDDPCAILFTSGTTGRSKGAVLTHRNLVTGLMCVQLSGAMVVRNIAAQYGITPDQVMAGRPQPTSLLVFPLFHISGLGAGLLSQLLIGGKIVIMPRWDVADALQLIAAEKVTMLSAVPTMLWDLLNRAALGDHDISSLTNVASGGQGLPLNLLAAVQGAMPRAFLGTGFGLTETAGAIAMATGPDFLRQPGSSGRVLALADVRVHGDDGTILPAGSTGEIAVRGPMVMAGYWNRPQETAEVLDAQGWFRTGDIGYVDEEGYIFIVDRKKDMVISGGENIYCAEVERVIGSLLQVAEVAAFGLPDDRMGERLVAVIVGDGLSADAVCAHVAAHLAAYKTPTQIAFSADPLPRNAVGKIDKIALRAAWTQLTGAA